MDYAAARRSMVENQIRANRVTDQRVLAVLTELPRELFAPEPLRGVAYLDEDLPLGGGRFLLEPRVAALLLQAADLGPDDVVLEVATGPGYLAAAAARLAGTVVALEQDPVLAASAGRAFADLQIDNAVVVEGPLTEGCPRQAPYNVILFNGAVAVLPDTFGDQLAEGGRIVAVFSREQGVGQGCIVEKHAGVLSRRAAFDAMVPLLPGFAAKPAFRF